MGLRASDLLGVGKYVGACLLAGGIGGFATARNGRTWYRTLDRPSWTPPDRVFGPVWTTLYVAMGLAGHLAARGGDERLLSLWRSQFFLNAAWSPVFFGLHRIGLAAVNSVLMWATIVAFVARARRSAPPAAWLFTPYLAWVTYATALNLEVWRRNRGRTPEDRPRGERVGCLHHEEDPHARTDR